MKDKSARHQNTVVTAKRPELAGKAVQLGRANPECERLKFWETARPRIAKDAPPKDPRKRRPPIRETARCLWV